MSNPVIVARVFGPGPDDESLIKELHHQANEELGTGPARLLVSKAEERMVFQKYGIIPPQFTNKEKKVIQREERRRAR